MSELMKLAEMLTKEGIPFEQDGTEMIAYPAVFGKRYSDVICRYGSYGYKEGLLEQMGLIPNEKMEELCDSVEGYLTAETVFERWKKHWYSSKEETV